jgi:hypothetical protein
MSLAAILYTEFVIPLFNLKGSAMYFKDKASQIYPEAVWTGGGPIHASIARNGEVPLSWDDKSLIMRTLIKDEFPGRIERTIVKACPDMEWLMNSESLSNLVLVDYYRLLCGSSTMATKHRLKNPSTGNYFHRISLNPKEDFVGGVRVWITPMTEDQCQIGFRFRLESLIGEDEHTKVREKASAQVLELEAEMIEIKEFIAKNKSEQTAEVELEHHLNF